MEKKFKVRVRHFLRDKYEVQFAYYYFIPKYRSLLFWFEQLVDSGTECWSTALFDYKTAEKVAQSLKSMKDVNRWFEKEDVKRQKFYRRKKEYFDKNVPYNIKYFNT
jgi:hypothetical protein